MKVIKAQNHLINSLRMVVLTVTLVGAALPVQAQSAREVGTVEAPGQAGRSQPAPADPRLLEDYAARERAAPQLENFEGGDVVIGTTAAIIILAVVLLLILL